MGLELTSLLGSLSCFISARQLEELLDILNFLRIYDLFDETSATKVRSFRGAQMDLFIYLFFALQQFKE